MKFIDLAGTLAKARRFVSYASSVQEAEVKDHGKLAEILRRLSARLATLESQTTAEAIEFEVEVGTAGALTSLTHNIGGPVRFSVVFWTKVGTGSVYPTTGPILIADETSSDIMLVLRSYTAGRAIVRVEPAFKGIAYNVI